MSKWITEAMRWLWKTLFVYWRIVFRVAHPDRKNFSPIRVAISSSTWRVNKKFLFLFHGLQTNKISMWTFELQVMEAMVSWNFKTLKKLRTKNWPMRLNKCGKSEGKILFWKFLCQIHSVRPCEADISHNVCLYVIVQFLFVPFADTMKFSLWSTHAKQHPCTRNFIRQIF